LLENLNKLFVYPTQRSIKNSLKKEKTLINIISIKEFFETVVFVKNRIIIDKIGRFLILKEAIESIDIKKIGFSGNFLDFLEHSQFIFKFFDELNSEFVPFGALRGQDVYAEFEDHLSLLEKVYLEYKKILEQKGYHDPSIYDSMEINIEYVKRFEEIVIKTVGYLTKKELKTIADVSKYTKVTITLEIDRYNKNMLEKLNEFGFLLEGYGLYELNFNDLSYTKQSLKSEFASINSYRFSQKISQGAYIFHLLYKLKNDPKTDSIHIILLDEDFEELLKGLDFFNNLNFAMGEPLQKTELFKNITSLLEEKSELLLSQKGIEPLATLLKNSFKNHRNFDLIRDTLFSLEGSKKLLENYNSYDVGELLMRELKKSSLDDIGGGKIKVTGLLEARNIELDSVIVVGFNKGIFPSKNQKDLFLNSKLKRACGIPTNEDRENLQMHFFASLLRSAKRVDILYLENEDFEPSAFLSHFPHKEIAVLEGELNSAFFGRQKREALEDDEIVEDINLKTFTLSHTSLQTYLTCKRKFYYRYIKKLKDSSEENRVPLMLGSRFHEVMRELGEEIPLDEVKLLDILKNGMIKKGDSALELFEADLFLKGCESFVKKEVERLKSGIKPLYFELELESEIEGFRFKGTIDRVDLLDDGYAIIDYKTGKNIKIDTSKNVEKSTNFQLAIYKIALQNELNISANSAFYYDIKRGALLNENTLCVKEKLLREKLQELAEKRQTFSKTHLKTECRRCPYTILCGRE